MMRRFLLTFRCELRDDVVGKRIGEAVELGVACFVIEAGYGDGERNSARAGAGVEVADNNHADEHESCQRGEKNPI